VLQVLAFHQGGYFFWSDVIKDPAKGDQLIAPVMELSQIFSRQEFNNRDCSEKTCNLLKTKSNHVIF
jgi:hypothetical protein